jgi:hypothetical protein
MRAIDVFGHLDLERAEDPAEVADMRAVVDAPTAQQNHRRRRHRPPPSPPTTFSGVEYDNISVSHDFIVGSPLPTQNQGGMYCCWPVPVRTPGSYIFSQEGFPVNVLPSGGSSNIISASEMIFVGLNQGPTSGPTSFEWHKAIGRDLVVYTFTAAGSYSWAYSFIGHFS